MEKQLSAVQWLKEQYYHSQGVLCRHDFQQAEKMFAEQIMKANADGVDSILEGTTPIGEKEYYENNFNNQ